ncbi:UPF0214 protein YbbE [Maritalea myrionectae]|uniref:UPF0214 protein YbbE n=1 Tax=Maritalea myrionectae TaxID=454601 RepID=A0A2R4MIF9_9HYPH|nr:serine hydrolase domain-containing protein [Maritalea myrionectae]AVX05714.1 UPF0214 protein YbbE [Maritalea myrionectae]
MATIEDLVQRHIARGTFPCAEILVATGDKVRFHQAFGFMEGSDIAPLKKGAMFDLASLTKPLATANLLVQLVREDRIGLDDAVSDYLPEFIAGRHTSISVRQLALHQAGLPAEAPLAKQADSADAAWQLIYQMPLAYAPGKKVIYSCLGYLLLGRIIEQVLDMSLDEAFAAHIAGPQKLQHTFFSPLEAAPHLPEIVPSVPAIRSSGFIRGVVNDSTARRLGGKVGNAGLFSTAADVHNISCALLDAADPLIFENGNGPGLTPRTIGFEFNDPDILGCSCGDQFFPGAVGHTGFTGTSLWMEPHSKLIVIALTNRVYLSYRDTIEAMRTFRAELHATAKKVYGV